MLFLKSIVAGGFVVIANLCIAAQSGGPFVIEKSTISGGGGRSAGGAFVLEGTLGEPIAGRTSSGGTFELGSGFWGGGNAPGASTVTIRGRVFTSGGGSLRNAVVSITGPTGVKRSVLTNGLGFYSFENVLTGGSYTINVVSKRYRFLAQTVSVDGALSDIDFTGIE